ncbi:MFS transporter [Nocardioides jensenii]|uniref:MFS transporter n=1 Tax=Nocardioides jensenii TaxID=1843 RepID=UPI00082F0728|nr:MFS transporter [Nocardioides jensenii]
MNGPDPHTRRSQTTGTLLAVAITICGALPTFLTSALAVQLQDDLHFGPGALGLATSVSFGVGGLTSRHMGRVVQHRGSRFGFHFSLTLAAIALMIVLVAPSYPVLVLALFVAGLGNAAAQPTANLMITEVVGRRRLGLAMGFKQSYIPIASLLGGLSVPIVAVNYGWRWAIGGAVVMCVITLAGGRRRTPGPRGKLTPVLDSTESTEPTEPTEPTGEVPTGPAMSRRGVLVLTIGGGLAAGSVTALGVFLVDAAVDAGVEPGMAGYLLAFCAACCLVGRVSAGWLADRIQGRSLYIASVNIMLLTVVGMLLLAIGDGWVFIVGAILGYLGWTWPGLFHLAVIRDSPGAVASATGTVQSGFSGGAAIGPVLLGMLVEATSYEVGWLTAAVISALGIVVVRWARRILRRDRGLPAGGPVPAAGSPPTDRRRNPAHG